MQRRHHYELAFEEFLRARRMPYVAVDEARKTLLPITDNAPSSALKSFDCVVYTAHGPRLIDVKGRKITSSSALAPRSAMQNWVTKEDIAALTRWQSLFGPTFAAVFAFVYWCTTQPPDGLFHEIIDFRNRWYCLRCVLLNDYIHAMRPRSEKWGTVSLPAHDFHRLSTSLS